MTNVCEVKIRKKKRWQYVKMVRGRIVRKTFKMRGLAIAFGQIHKAVGEEALKVFNSLTLNIIMDMVEAYKLLPKSMSLKDCVLKIREFYNDYTPAQLCFMYNEARRKEAISGKTLSEDQYQNYKTKTEDFVKHFPDFADMKPEKIIEYLLSKGKNNTIRNWKYAINAFLNLCVTKKAIMENPIKEIQAGDLLNEDEDETEITLSTPDEVEKLFEVLEVYHPKYIKYYALNYFAGVRVGEIKRMKEDFVVESKRHIDFPKNIAKNKKPVTFNDLPEAFWDWWLTYKDQPFRIPKANDNKELRALKMEQNTGRHSFCTYHLSLYNDQPKTMQISRHTHASTLQKHYVAGQFTREFAGTYFDNRPKLRCLVSEPNTERKPLKFHEFKDGSFNEKAKEEALGLENVKISAAN